jgi:hypothetical protein
VQVNSCPFFFMYLWSRSQSVWLRRHWQYSSLPPVVRNNYNHKIENKLIWARYNIISHITTARKLFALRAKLGQMVECNSLPKQVHRMYDAHCITEYVCFSYHGFAMVPSNDHLLWYPQMKYMNILFLVL